MNKTETDRDLVRKVRFTPGEAMPTMLNFVVAVPLILMTVATLVSVRSTRLLLRIALAGSLGSVFLLSVGCIVPTAAEPPSTPTSLVTSHPNQVPNFTPDDANVIQVCLDATGSYSRDLFHHATDLIADGVERMVVPGQEGSTIVISLITSSSYSDTNTVQVISVPPVPNEFTPPSPPTMGDVNPYDVDAKQAKEAEYARQLAVYEQALAEQEEHIRQTQERLAREANALRSLNPLVDNQGTDVYGCLSRAADRFKSTTGRPVLLVATDMLGEGPQQNRPDLQLAGASVRIFDYASEYAQDNYYREQLWNSFFTMAGAVDVRFIDPGLSQALTFEDLVK